MADNDRIFNISSTISWFLNQFYNILRWVYSQLDRLVLVGNFSLLDFCITCVILGVLIEVLVATVNSTRVTVSVHEHSSKDES